MYLYTEIATYLGNLLERIPGILGVKLRNLIYKKKFLDYGENVIINEGVKIIGKSNFRIGSNTGINTGCWINSSGGLTIGNNVILGPHVIIHTQNHNYKDVKKLIKDQGWTKKSVVIEDNVWIAAGVIIAPGVLIGTGSVVGAGSVVTKYIPPFSLVVGNPGSIKKNIY